MDSKKAERLKKHEKEIKRKAYLNLFLTLLVGIGVGTVLWGPAAEVLNFLIGESATTTAILAFIVLGGLVYMTPLLHYKEENEIKSDKKPDYYLKGGWDKTPLIEFVESRGWEEIEKSEQRIVLEKYPSILHEAAGKKSTMEIEILEKEGNQEIVVFKLDGKEIEKVKAIVKPEEEGSIIQETGVSLKRYSPAYLELLLFILPQVKEAMEDAANEEIELLDENIEYRISKYNLDTE